MHTSLCKLLHMAAVTTTVVLAVPHYYNKPFSHKHLWAGLLNYMCVWLGQETN